MVASSLVWELTKNHNSFIRKRGNGKTKRAGSVVFSVEKGNIKSLNQHKYSGLANDTVYDVVATEDGRAALLKKSASKANAPSKSMATIALNKADFRKVEKTIKNSTSAVFYRRDLEAAALGKWTKVYQANKRVKGVKKGVPPKMGRGTL